MFLFHRKIHIIVLMVLLHVFCASNIQAQTRTVSPQQYGYDEAKNGEERFAALYRTHAEAVRQGAVVDYSGLNEIDLVIPPDAKSIPLTGNNDFSGVTFNVKNTSKNFILFQRTFAIEPIAITKCMIKRGRYSSIKKMTNGRALLIIEDKTPWVETRKGYNYSAIRKEAIIVENGKACNNPIYSYNTKQSNPIAFYRSLDGNNGTTIANLTLNRSKGSTYITYLLKISNDDGVNLTNINVNTPESTLTKDAIITIENATNVVFKNVLINNTYSDVKTYGYGVSLENVFNVQFDHFSGYGKWGVFGNNNVNKATFLNCRMNRFDIHCYGKDVTFNNCEFFDLYNQFSSFYGKLIFNRCTFTNFIPVSLEMSYNAYTGFEVYFEKCTFNTTSERHSLISVGRIDEVGGERFELQQLCWPNVYVNNLTVNAGYGANPLYVFVCRGNEQKRVIDYLSEVKVDGLVYNTTDLKSHIKSISLCNTEVTTANRVSVYLSDVKLESHQTTKAVSPQEGRVYINLKPKKGKKIKVNVEGSDVELVER